VEGQAPAAAVRLRLAGGFIDIPFQCSRDAHVDGCASIGFGRRLRRIIELLLNFGEL
jgi:hypothetical protein